MAEIFFTSDTHFGHERILQYDRDFPNIEDHDYTLIERWNSVVGKSDLVYHLGDLSFHSRGRTIEIMSQLNGQIFMVKGNHDSRDRIKQLVAMNLLTGWENLKQIKVENQIVVMCHYPLLTWNHAHKGAWMLHGHSHGNLKADNNTRLDVGVDCWNFAPVSYSQIAEAMKKRVFVPVDHHA